MTALMYKAKFLLWWMVNVRDGCLGVSLRPRLQLCVIISFLQRSPTSNSSLERRWLRDWFSLGRVAKYFGWNKHSGRRKTTTWWSMTVTRKRDKKRVHEAKLLKKLIGWINRTGDIVLTFGESTGHRDIEFVFKPEALPRPSWMWFSVVFPLTVLSRKPPEPGRLSFWRRRGHFHVKIYYRLLRDSERVTLKWKIILAQGLQMPHGFLFWFALANYSCLTIMNHFLF